ncbi:MAG: hypothetical protein SW019_16215 [Actinomycetota bacterium]|nr:hypothetical protein [Actinomycetota bacterium]
MTSSDGPDLDYFPGYLQRLVSTWYRWQRVYLWAHHRRPGENQRPPEKWESDEEVYWGALPPQMGAENVLRFANPSGEMLYILERKADGFYISTVERGSMQTYWMFRAFADAEKFLLYSINEEARPGRYRDSPQCQWARQGLDPRVSLEKTDPERYPSRVSLTVGHELQDRGWMGESDAVGFSHAIVLTFEELNEVLRQGIPGEAFSGAAPL